ncbi:MAG: hypothetical protein JO266_06415 [Acidobacteria bacterium]|nr:hypothetical protein [Acidobacteriota bacterium]MBV9479593.1 hypothetical protein [Acidobacteriota bacterium]
MEPVLLVHGYSAESAKNEPEAVAQIFGNLPQDLETKLDPPILDVNISRYISLDDGIDLEDITLAFDRALKNDFSVLYSGGFNAIVHSTGALVLRNWVRRCSPRPSPCRRIIHLAGANLGSGWAHIGETLLAKWLRFIGEGGAERGLAVLDDLEFGSNWAWELHRHFLQPGNSMRENYGVMEFSIIGSQPPPKNLIVPFRYGKEDGSDGVVRVAASNLNHHYVRIGPSRVPENINWNDAVEFSTRTVDASARGDLADFKDAHSVFAGNYYHILEENLPGEPSIQNANATATRRPLVPFAIPYCCAHSTQEMGIVSGTQTRKEVLELIRQALNCADEATHAAVATRFSEMTDQTYAKAAAQDKHLLSLKGLFAGAEKFVKDFLHTPQAQYDRHAQVGVRVRDQHGNAINDCSIHFNSFGGGAEPGILINELFEDTHQNKASPDTTTFYLRLEAWNGANWRDRLVQVNGVDLEIDCIDPKTQRVVFVPLRMRLNTDQLTRYVKSHRATLIDVELLRLPARETFSMYPIGGSPKPSPDARGPST